MILWLGIISTALAYSLYSYGLSHLRASNVATLVLAEPVTATLLAITVLHNQLTLSSWLGVGLVVSGLLYLGIKG
jgi:DME family drug/metabolite transporter